MYRVNTMETCAVITSYERERQSFSKRRKLLHTLKNTSMPPALAVEPDDFFRRETHVRRHQYQPVLPIVAIADKDKPHGEGFFALDDSGFHNQQILLPNAMLNL